MRYPRVRILQYHGIGEYPESLFGLREETFLDQLAYLSETGYNVVSLDDALNYMKNSRKVPENVVALTFDHGYSDAYQKVAPLLLARGFPAAFFLNPFWIGVKREVSGKEVSHMGLREIRELADNGFTVGLYLGEGRSIEKKGKDALIFEIREKRSLLEYALERDVSYAAAKEGVLSRRVRRFMEAEGFRGFFTQCPTRRASHPLAVGRIQIDDPDQNIFLMKISNSYLFYKDSRAFPVMRKLKLNWLVHRVSEALGELKSFNVADGT